MTRNWSRLAASFAAVALFVVGLSVGTALALGEEGAGSATDPALTTAEAAGPEPPVTTTEDPAETTTAEAPAPSPTDSAGTPEPPPPASSPPIVVDPPPAPSQPPVPTPVSPPSAAHPGIASTRHSQPAPELESPLTYATIWLHRWLPDPTPPAHRLAPAFARHLRQTAAQAGVRWSLLLAVLRERGHEGRVPATRSTLEPLARRLEGVRPPTLDQGVQALERYNRAVGLRGLVVGLEAVKPLLERRLLEDARVSIYPSGRWDVASGRIDVRVLVLIRYLAVTFDQVTVSSLRSEHPYFARPGVVSAHTYGFAVDIAALGGTFISGNQGLGSVTQRAVEAILLLPAELQPQQVISLLGLGGASFALADHNDHIHVGY
jgi:hypothetical protein